MGCKLMASIAATIALAGCGATASAPTPTPAPTGQDSFGWPSGFAGSFVQSCLNGGLVRSELSNSEGCECVDRNIESISGYSSWVASAQDIANGDPPSWFTDAEDMCEL